MFRTIAIVSILLAAICFAAESSNLLDGKTFVGESGEKGKEGKDKDSLIFADGQFHSTACDQYGFAPAPYTAKKDEDTIIFEADTTSPKEGKIHWHGTVTGDNCEGTLQWTKEGQGPIEYWFKGSIQK